MVVVVEVVLIVAVVVWLRSGDLKGSKQYTMCSGRDVLYLSHKCTKFD